MKKLIKGIICIIIGIFMIPAIYALGATLMGTLLAFIANPRVMTIILLIFAVLAFPGFVLVKVFKK